MGYEIKQEEQLIASLHEGKELEKEYYERRRHKRRINLLFKNGVYYWVLSEARVTRKDESDAQWSVKEELQFSDIDTLVNFFKANLLMEFYYLQVKDSNNNR